MKSATAKKNPAKKHKFSKQWMREHVNDPFVQLAQKEGYRSRAAYKLLEIDAKDRLLKPGTVVVDLGATPGGWSQVAAARVGGAGKVIALDLLPLDPLPGVDFIQGDFREEAVLKQLEDLLHGKPVGLVISDMAPNISGVASADQARAIHLAELALEFALEHLKPEGSFLVKVFQGAGFEDFLKLMRNRFSRVVTRKPKASRDRSSELYLLGSGKLE
jgi:23S rRNA (uridine2552-2'-O)-methyltransferase